MTGAPVLDIRGLRVRFRTERGLVHAVNDLSYAVETNETVGIVGESGSGKSAHLLALLGLQPKATTLIEAGEAIFGGRDLLKLSEGDLEKVRGREIGFVFQDPMTALNPVLSIGRQLREPLIRHLGLSRRAADDRAADLLDQVGLRQPRAQLAAYPHQLSGGMRQRVMIAIAVACDPKLLIADEPTTALDVTVQAQILDLVARLQERSRMSVIWVTHDMGVVSGIADRLQVMYAGRVVETGPTASVLADPRNAYTWSLLQSIPDPARPRRRLHQIKGQAVNLLHLPPGDAFAPRNPFATERCRQEAPPLRDIEGGVAGHKVAAWYDLPALLAHGDAP